MPLLITPIITAMRRTAVLCAALLLGLAFTLVSRDTDSRLKKASRSAEHNGWIQVHLEGKPAEIGFQHGYLLANEIADTFKAVTTEMVHDEKHDWAFFRKAAEEVFWPHGGIRNKAARGELRRGLPVGLVWGEQDGEVLLHP